MLEALRVQLAALGKEGRLEASQPRLVAPLDDLERLVLVEPYLKAVRGRRSEAVLVRARVVPPCVDAELRARLGVSEVAPLLVERERERERERENRTYRSVPAAVEALRGKTRSGWLLRAAPSERELRTHRTDPLLHDCPPAHPRRRRTSERRAVVAHVGEHVAVDALVDERLDRLERARGAERRRARAERERVGLRAYLTVAAPGVACARKGETRGCRVRRCCRGWSR